MATEPWLKENAPCFNWTPERVWPSKLTLIFLFSLGADKTICSSLAISAPRKMETSFFAADTAAFNSSAVDTVTEEAAKAGRAGSVRMMQRRREEKSVKRLLARGLAASLREDPFIFLPLKKLYHRTGRDSRESRIKKRRGISALPVANGRKEEYNKMYFFGENGEGREDAMEKQRKFTVGQAAWRGICAHPGEIASMAAAQILLRAAALLPLALQALWTGGSAVPGGVWIALSLLLYVLLVIPFRFRAGEVLRRCSAPRLKAPRGGKPYANWLRTGLSRWGRGLLWGLPFLLCMGYFVYGWANLPFNTMWMPVLALTLPGTAALILLFALLFVYGWWRDLPVEYLPARHLGVHKTLFFSRRARKTGGKMLIRNALVNALLSLPAAVGVGAVMIPYVRDSLPAVKEIRWIITGILQLLRTPLPQRVLIRLLAVYLALYLPLCLLRKMRNAVVVRRLTREVNDLGDEHAAG